MRLTRCHLVLFPIFSLTTSDGTTLTDPEEIEENLKITIEKLYESRDTDLCASENFLNNLSLPHLTGAQLQDLNTPITQHEISRTIAQLAYPKSPGPDGYTSEFFKLLKEQITPTLEALYNM